MISRLCVGSPRRLILARDTRTNTRSIAVSVLMGIVLLAVTLTTEARGKPDQAGKPGAPQILPVNLGAAPECPRTHGLGLNSGNTAGLYVVGQGRGCANAALIGAVRWSSSVGMQYLGLLPGSTGSTATGVSEDGTVVGSTSGDAGQAFVLEPGSASLVRLPPLAGMVHATADNISQNGLYIVGTSSTNEEQHAVVWKKRPDGSWQVHELAPSGVSPAIADNGRALFNTSLDEFGNVHSARVIEANGSQSILPGFDILASDISADGDTIVGHRSKACPDPCGKYPVPVYWTLLPNGTWAGPVDLPAIDGVDSEPRAIAKRNGRRLIVGYGFTKKDAIMRSVAWVEDSQGRFELHRLAAIAGKGKSWAEATDVNSHGQVTGTSQSTGLSFFAVLWQLP